VVCTVEELPQRKFVMIILVEHKAAFVKVQWVFLVSRFELVTQVLLYVDALVAILEELNLVIVIVILKYVFDYLIQVVVID
jgi:hypothetical protein